jgi:hypothetical protein
VFSWGAEPHASARPKERPRPSERTRPARSLEYLKVPTPPGGSMRARALPGAVCRAQTMSAALPRRARRGSPTGGVGECLEDRVRPREVIGKHSLAYLGTTGRGLVWLARPADRPGVRRSVSWCGGDGDCRDDEHRLSLLVHCPAVHWPARPRRIGDHGTATPVAAHGCGGAAGSPCSAVEGCD